MCVGAISANFETELVSSRAARRPKGSAIAARDASILTATFPHTCMAEIITWGTPNPLVMILLIQDFYK
ncbi:hypothetical protein HanPSC8_Chr17g0780381 [Helianthus annuus]|nr:hypothetical protein HanPSC8_Chr17g0780381 [Helianthus annuus]